MKISITSGLEDPLEIMEHQFHLLKMESNNKMKIMKWESRCFLLLMLAPVALSFIMQTSITFPLAITLTGTALTLCFLTVSLFVYPPLETRRRIHIEEGLLLEKKYPIFLSTKYFELLLKTNFSRSRSLVESSTQAFPLLLSGGSTIYGIVMLCMKKSFILAILIGTITSLGLILITFLIINGSRRRQKIQSHLKNTIAK